MVVNINYYLMVFGFANIHFFSCIQKEVVYREIHNLFYLLKRT